MVGDFIFTTNENLMKQMRKKICTKINLLNVRLLVNTVSIKLKNYWSQSWGGVGFYSRRISIGNNYYL